jgi:hypothetical protein
MCEIRTKVTCPYCDLEQRVLYHYTSHMAIHHCNTQGGCDKPFILERPEIELKALRIEGYHLKD